MARENDSLWLDVALAGLPCAIIGLIIIVAMLLTTSHIPFLL